jgi:EAL domain-containing protein (putative c-di-GMP-specific phosphodiesterase class I)
VVSEGVETSDQLDYLTLQGCDIMQGFLFSRPLPVEKARDMLASQPFAGADGRLQLLN